MRIFSQSFGYTSSAAFGADAMGYSVYGGDVSALGMYTARIYPSAFVDVAFTITAEVNGITVWVKELMFYGTELTSLSYLGWDVSPSPLGDFNVTLDSIPEC